MITKPIISLERCDENNNEPVSEKQTNDKYEDTDLQYREQEILLEFANQADLLSLPPENITEDSSTRITSSVEGVVDAPPEPPPPLPPRASFDQPMFFVTDDGLVHISHDEAIQPVVMETIGTLLNTFPLSSVHDIAQRFLQSSSRIPTQSTLRDLTLVITAQLYGRHEITRGLHSRIVSVSETDDNAIRSALNDIARGVDQAHQRRKLSWQLEQSFTEMRSNINIQNLNDLPESTEVFSSPRSPSPIPPPVPPYPETIYADSVNSCSSSSSPSVTPRYAPKLENISDDEWETLNIPDGIDEHGEPIYYEY